MTATTHLTIQLLSGVVIEIAQGDITLETVDAIVNAANGRLAHGGGVAGAISRRGGPRIQKESSLWVAEHGMVSHAEPAYTSGGDLPCRYVIHAVGPVWGSGDEEHKLAQAISGSLRQAEKLKLNSIAFPAISTGIFGFPIGLAAKVYRDTLANYGQESDHHLQLIRLVLYDNDSLNIFLEIFREQAGKGQA